MDPSLGYHPHDLLLVLCEALELVFCSAASVKTVVEVCPEDDEGGERRSCDYPRGSVRPLGQRLVDRRERLILPKLRRLGPDDLEPPAIHTPSLSALWLDR
jgi:hypothetical protein